MPFLNRQKVGRLRLVLLFIGICLCWIVLPTQARATTGTIADDAQVLNTATISQYTDKFTYTVDIFATRDFQGSNDAFDASVQGLTSDEITPTPFPTPTDSSTSTPSSTPIDSITPTTITCDPKYQVGCQLFDTSLGVMLRQSDATDSIEIGIDVSARHLAIYSGKGVKITQDHYDNAIRVFADTMHQTHDNYTQATIAALNALQNDNDRFWDGVRAQAPWFLLVALVVGVILYAKMFGVTDGNPPSSSSGSSSGYEYEHRHHYDSWNNNSGNNSGGGFGGGNNGGGSGGGGGASGNF
jgi:hypothetical protein